MLKEMTCVNCEQKSEVNITKKMLDENLFRTMCPNCEAVGFFEVPKLNGFEKSYISNHDSLPHCSGIGGYPLFYQMNNGDVICPDCASKDLLNVCDYHVYWEGSPINCDGCNAEIESAYGEPDDGE